MSRNVNDVDNQERSNRIKADSDFFDEEISEFEDQFEDENMDCCDHTNGCKQRRMMEDEEEEEDIEEEQCFHEESFKGVERKLQDIHLDVDKGHRKVNSEDNCSDLTSEDSRETPRSDCSSNDKSKPKQTSVLSKSNGHHSPDCTDMTPYYRRTLGPEPAPLQQRTVIVKKDVRESLGMRIGGGIGSNEGDTPIYIANIHPNGCVGKSRHMKVGIATTKFIVF